ncbi:MAG: AI-2E family transporter [Gammaproteobacteria bacterium]|nr:AI-2E family transporter [Gammaproteobacteria bacterium]NIR96847.1 AI-2E family transporter [Gammaproteobacteria bacterium]NIT62558.1 AI-2E family transporter [Gammaproteobacteria bacterium]NIV19502.1 AI-2E family transporter [Gammaproteobacteria bacterium]NIY31138.1 AI-2E family transporter [Gammaproteobacteria bacterium]
MDHDSEQAQTEPARGPRSGAPVISLGPLAVALFLATLLALSFMVLRDFIVPLLWAAVLVYTSWPLYQRLVRRLGNRINLGAGLMTLLLVTALVMPLLSITALLGEELANAYRAAQARLAAGPPSLPAPLAEIPWLGERLQALLDRLAGDPAELRDWLGAHAPQWLETARGILGAIARNIVKLAVTLFALFFLFRDGERIISETQLVLRRFLGERVQDYWLAVTTTTRGVIYGLVLTALAQGILAGLGYWAAGLGTPALLGALTALLALIPFGAPLVWGSTGLWLLVMGELWAGIGLLLWGGLIVSMIDNVVRPLAISSAARIPFFLVLLGVFGGLRAFGLVGLFLGPIVLTVMLAVWREWLEERMHGHGDRKTGSEGEKGVGGT